MAFNASEWHSRVKSIFLDDPNYRTWAETAPFNGRLIPFCTPIPEATEIVVIGKNHAAFDKNHSKAEEIANAFSQNLPKVSTFLVHNHTYQRGLDTVVRKSGLAIDDRWVGTNRCPIQTGSDMNELERLPWFKSLLPRMDRAIEDLIIALKPRYVITCGVFPSRTFYKNEKALTDMEPREFAGSILVPIKHPSRGSFHAFSVGRLQKYIS